MNNAIAMTAEFNRQKNTKASLYTLMVLVTVLLIFFWIKISQPLPPPQPVEEIIDINLGTDDIGSGNDQPQLPGEPAPAQQAAYSPPQPAQSQEEAVKDIEEDKTEDDAPKIVKPNNPKPEATKINEETKTVKTPDPKPAEVVAPTPPKPKAVLGRTTGSNGNGGNGADTYKPGTGEGQGGGPGDQGRPGGNPNGTTYTGAPRNLGIRTVSIPAQNFEDDFKESGKIALDITVNDNGKLIAANFQPRGSTLSNRSQIEIAKRRAAQIAYPKYEGGFKQTIVMNFQVRN